MVKHRKGNRPRKGAVREWHSSRVSLNDGDICSDHALPERVRQAMVNLN